ncbi:MAG: hypothetical protein R2819_01620 [Allomuricauda sp.]
MKKYNSILLVEDDRKKIDDISEFVKTKFPESKLTTVKSFRGGLKEIFTNNYDLLLLDMTIPKWDDDSLGESIEYENFGGFNIMKEMKRKKKTLPTIVITMFNKFVANDKFVSIDSIETLCQGNFEFYLGLVYYSSKNEEWKDKLESVICKS